MTYNNFRAFNFIIDHPKTVNDNWNEPYPTYIVFKDGKHYKFWENNFIKCKCTSKQTIIIYTKTEPWGNEYTLDYIKYIRFSDGTRL